MAIPEEDVARVVAATDLVALIGEHAALKRQGARFVGLCPFHQEKSPSFSVSPEKGFYHCFGCQRSGDAISFVREIEHVDFVEAVRRLADRAGITIAEDAAESVERKRRGPLYDAVAGAVDFYHQRLLSAPDAGPARDYLRSRGYSGEVVRTFRLGWAPDDWDALARHLKVSDSVFSDAGLGFVNRRGRQQDGFRARIVFPIFDPSNKPVALGGRILPPAAGVARRDVGPKYKNSPEGPIYSKRRTLYGLNWAKRAIIERGEVVVCEGYTDVIAFFQADLPCAVATCGTALGEEHFRLLRNFAKRVVLAYDADAAGQSGANRVYEWERHHEVDVAVAALPPGADPADLVRSDPEQLRKAVADAQPFLRFRVEHVLAAADLRSAEGRAKAAEATLAAVAEHPNDLVRDQYLMMVADRCRLDATALRPLLVRLVHDVRTGVQVPGPGRRAGARSSDAPGGDVRHGEEQPVSTDDIDVSAAGAASPATARRPGGDATRSGLEALRLTVHDRASVVHRLDPVLFPDPVQRVAFEALARCEDLHQAVDWAERQDPDVARLLRRVAVEEPAGAADDVVMLLVRNATRRALGDIEQRGRLAPEDLGELASMAATVRYDLEELDDPEHALAASDRLLAWLIGMAKTADE